MIKNSHQWFCKNLNIIWYNIICIKQRFKFLLSETALLIVHYDFQILLLRVYNSNTNLYKSVYQVFNKKKIYTLHYKSQDRKWKKKWKTLKIYDNDNLMQCMVYNTMYHHHILYKQLNNLPKFFTLNLQSYISMKWIMNKYLIL